MDPFGPTDDMLMHPRADRGRQWQRAYGTETLRVSSQALFVTDQTSHHDAPPSVTLRISGRLNARITKAAASLRARLTRGSDWTTDAMYRETTAKVERLRRNGVATVDMQPSALAGVAHLRRCGLSALLVVSDVLAEPHNWEGVNSREFSQGVQVAAALAALVLLR